ncbi:MAG: hypothetical protein UT32_C0010G0031 [Parcubacteria group bacterium GW2011_GWC2_39_14]|nr:MAG: hypothetical protein UT32_C0010G0031 [Parcubacteria group bacterium GW2011_GWC2_39_14]KKR55142.1 MAG: hypothetical protein UT91_C0004G0041 [Parcubacteria group bacterium GW2011_GWA2_40_23]
MSTKTKTKTSKSPVKSTPSNPVGEKHKTKWGFVILFAVCSVLVLITVLTILCDGMMNVFVRVPSQTSNVIRIFDPKAVEAQAVTQSFSRDQGIDGYTLYEVKHNKIVLTKAGTNEIIWEKNWPGGEPALALITGDRVYLARYEQMYSDADGLIGSIYNFDLQTGELIWPITSINGQFVKLFLQDNVLVLATKRSIEPGWGCGEGMSEAEAEADCSRPRRTYITGSDKIFAFDAKTGDQLWEREIFGYQQVTLPDNSQFLEVTYDQNKKEYYFIEDGTVPPETTMIESDNTIKKDE